MSDVIEPIGDSKNAQYQLITMHTSPDTMIRKNNVIYINSSISGDYLSCKKIRACNIVVETAQHTKSNL